MINLDQFYNFVMVPSFNKYYILGSVKKTEKDMLIVAECREEYIAKMVCDFLNKKIESPEFDRERE